MQFLLHDMKFRFSLIVTLGIFASPRFSSPPPDFQRSMPRASSLVIGHSTLVIPRRRRGGFALLITITLLAFLVLLLVSLASLTRVETQVASNSQHVAKARQNALFALNIALGQLQKSAGPDQRVTAAAEVLSNTDPTKKKWTGVWDTRSANLSNPPVWLVSQATQAAADAPNNAIPAPTLAAGVMSSSTAVRLVSSGSADTSSSVPAEAGNAVIVPVQDITSSSDPGVTGSPTVGRFGYWVGDEGIKARVNLIDPYREATDDISRINRVGSAQRNAWELFSGPTSPTPATTDPATILTSTMMNGATRMLTAQQIKLLANTDAAATDTLTKISTARFHDYSLWSAGVQADVRNGGLKWDLSTAFDLSDALFQTSEFGDNAWPLVDNSQSTQKAASGNVSPILAWKTTAGVSPHNVSFVFSPLVEFNNSGTQSQQYLRGPTWHLLRSHYRLYQTQTSPTNPTPLSARAAYPSGKAAGYKLNDQDAMPSIYAVSTGYGAIAKDPNLNGVLTGGSTYVPRPTQVGLDPYINRVMIRYGVRTVQREVTNTSTTDPGYPSSATVYAVQLVMQPIVVLHNPYDKDLVLGNYSGKTYSFASGLSSQVAGVIQTGATGTTAGLPFAIKTIINGYDRTTTDGVVNINSSGSNMQNFAQSSRGSNWPTYNLFIPPMTLKAGELKILYPQTGGNSLLVKPEGANQAARNAVDTTRVLMGTTPNTQDGFVVPFLTNQPNNNPVNPNLCSPLRTEISSTTDLTKAVRAADNTAPPVNPNNYGAEVWCNNLGDDIKVVFNSAGGDMEIKYGLEARSGDDAYSFECPLNYQISIYGPPFRSNNTEPSGTDNKAAAYYDYYVGGTRADNARRPAYAMTAGSCFSATQFFFALDYYAKPADHPSSKATRSFITSNPVAFEQYGRSMGDQSASGVSNGTSGFPKTPPAYQVEFRDTYGPNFTDDVALSNNSPMWGPTNGTNPARGSSPGTGATGQSWLDGSSSGLTELPLIHVPTRPMSSLAEFQHANITTYGYQPYFATGNSYATPYVPANSSVNPVGYYNGKSNPYFLYDMSYWMNDALWDKYFFSSISQEMSGGTSGAWNTTDTTLTNAITRWLEGNRTTPVANSRMIPHDGVTTAAANLSNLQTAYRQAAASLLTRGSFNINSQSIDAWAAVLGAARDANMVAKGGATTSLSNAAAVPRMTPANSTSQRDNNPLSQNSWTGFAALTDAQIRQLATNVVAEIRRRQAGTTYTHVGKIAGSSSPTSSYTGPFRSLSDFINRNLLNDLGNGTTSTGAKGALQAALDEAGNTNSPNYRFYTGSSYSAGNKGDASVAQGTSGWAFKWATSTNSNNDYLAGQGPTASTASGFILQADVLQQIGPFLSARSDTFTIRSYGESVNPATGESMGKAWCEAVVQRFPEYVDQADPALTATSYTKLGVALKNATPVYNPATVGDPSLTPVPILSTANQNFGRRFKVVSFRWLSPQDI
jgi:hypothetical protein